MNVSDLRLKLMPPPSRDRTFQQPTGPADTPNKQTPRSGGRIPRPSNPRPPSGPPPRRTPPPRRLPRLNLPHPRLTLPRPHLGLPRPALWSRYTLGLAALLVLALAARLPQIWAAPLDTPSGPQAALAVFVRRLAASGGDVKAALPWTGPLPTDPLAGLPLYAWLVALLGGGGAVWIGRGVALVGALLATGLLFVVVRRLAGGRAALYAALFLTVAPPGLYYGRAFLPDSLGWAAACGALAATLRWRDGILAGRPDGRRWLVGAAAASGLAILIAPANVALLPALIYLAWPHRRALVIGQVARANAMAPVPGGIPASLAVDLQQRRATVRTLQVQAYGFAALVALPLLLWWGLRQVAAAGVELDPAYGGGPSAVLSTLRDGGFYGLLAGRLVNDTLTFAGLLLLLAGLGRPTRQPWPWAIHCWVAGGLAVVLLSAPRLAADDATLAPWLPALAALAGLGANWLATLPALVAAVLRGQEEEIEDLDADRADGVPADEAAPPPAPDGARPVRGAVRKPGLTLDAAARRAAGWPGLRTGLLRLGNVAAILLTLAVLVGGANALMARYAVSPASTTYADAGTHAAATAAGKPGSRLVVAGPGAPEIFYTAGLPGWAVPEDRFTLPGVEALKSQGANLLVSADLGWFVPDPAYPGLLASHHIAVFDESFILFDLHSPGDPNLHYFPQTGHMMQGPFWTYWQAHGGVTQFGYPLTDARQEASPADGKTRTVQYFERAVFELHPDQKGTPYEVQLAPVGLWILQAHEKQAETLATRIVGIDPVPATPDTPTFRYLAQTGHSVKGEFLKFWQAHGGVPLLGYPVSEELNEISPADGKVHIVQYFQRARLEWHQEAAGTAAQVQLGLVGKEWLAQPGP